MTCSRHLKENCSRKIDEVLGSSSPERRAVMDTLFGTAGLISCTEVVLFDACTTKLQTAELHNTPAVFLRLRIAASISSDVPKCSVWKQ